MSDKKRGPLTVAEKFYIEQHVNKKPLSAIAKDLNRAETCIRNYCDNLSAPTVVEADTVDGPKKVPPNPNRHKCITNTRNREKSLMHNMMTSDASPGITIMTAAASQAADESKGRYVEHIDENKKLVPVHQQEAKPGNFIRYK